MPKNYVRVDGEDPVLHKQSADYDPYFPNDIINVNRDNSDYLANKKNIGSFADRVRKFSPRTNELGEDIINRLKNKFRKDSEMYFHPESEAETGETQPRNNDESANWFHREFDDMRNRNPRFRMPQWMSDEDDMSNLASRMTHSPRFSSLGRRGVPRKERKNSAGSNRSGASEEDHVDATHHFQPFPGAGGQSGSSNAIQIPIRLEADAPPGWEPSPKSEPLGRVQSNPLQGSDAVQHNHSSGSPHGRPGMEPNYQGEVPRNTRCVSAPPEMPDKFTGRRYGPNVQGGFSSSPVFNNTPKPFISSHKMQCNSPIMEERGSNQYVKPGDIPKQYSDHEQYSDIPPNRQQHHYQSQPNQDQWSNLGQKPGVVRNIPIIFENQNERYSPSRSSPPVPPPRSPAYSQKSFPSNSQAHRGSNMDQDSRNSPFRHGSPFGFHQNDPFFDFNKENHPTTGNCHPRNEYVSQEPQGNYHQNPGCGEQVHQPKQDKSFTESNVEREQPSEPRDVKMDQIASVRKSVTELQSKVQDFQGKEKNKDYVYLDEMLTRALLQLDNIEPNGRDDLRQARKSLIKDINETISILEKKIETPVTASECSATGENEVTKNDNSVIDISVPQNTAAPQDNQGNNIRTEITININENPPTNEVSNTSNVPASPQSSEHESAGQRNAQTPTPSVDESPSNEVESKMETDQPIPLPPPPGLMPCNPSPVSASSSGDKLHQESENSPSDLPNQETTGVNNGSAPKT